MNWFFKFLIVMTFILVSCLTWLAGPIQKALEKVQHKETVKANYRVCTHMRSMEEVYEKYVRNMFASGCLAEVKFIYNKVVPESKQDRATRAKIILELEDENSDFFQETMNQCHEMAADYNRMGRISEALVSNIYYQKLNCPAVYKELDKLGIKQEDIDNEDAERAKQPPQEGE